MTVRRTILRRIATVGARTGAAGSAVMLLLTMFGLPFAGVPEAGAAVTVGTATVVNPFDGGPEQGQPLDEGGSATPFSLLLPSGAACTGDSTNAGYRVQSYIVPSSVNPATLTWDANGPVPTGVGANLRQPLYQATSTAYVSGQTADANPVGGPGPIISIPAFSYGVYSPGNVPAGVYNIGIACTLGGPSSTQLDKYWNTTITVVADSGDEPAQIAWTVGGGSTTTTTTASTTTTTGGSTTTTTTDGSTTTTLDDSSTTTSTTVAGGGGTGGTSVGGSITSLPVTGGSPMAMLVWAVLLLLFGRAALILGRPIRVRPAKR
jgi:hypothetical protein